MVPPYVPRVFLQFARTNWQMYLFVLARQYFLKFSFLMFQYIDLLPPTLGAIKIIINGVIQLCLKKF